MSFNFLLLLPEGVVLGVLVTLLAGEISHSDFSKKFSGVVALAGSLLVFLSLLPLAGKMGSAFGGMFILDPLSTFFKTFLILTGFVIIAMSREFFQNLSKPGEFFLILWSALLALFFLVSANDFLLLFIALEITTLSFYVMAAYLKHDLLSIEAGLKYLILGSLASAFLIYGISLLYIGAGSTTLPDIRETFAADPHNRWILLGILFILSGLGFKVAAVPFQLWVPDVYEGAPTPVVAFLSVGSKAAGFALLLRLLFTVFVPFEFERRVLFAALAAMTLLYGTLGALRQTNIKRLMGYSSIGHAGYLLMGIAVGKEIGSSALLYYLMTYAAANLASFFAMTLAGRALQSDRIDSYRGLSHRSPFLAGTIFISMISLAGVPPLAGFFGKFLILLAAVREGLGWLALLGALAVAVSLYYYLSVVRVMYVEESSRGGPIALSPLAKTILTCLILALLVLGLWQTPFLTFAHAAARSLF